VAITASANAGERGTEPLALSTQLRVALFDGLFRRAQERAELASTVGFMAFETAGVAAQVKSSGT